MQTLQELNIEVERPLSKEDEKKFWDSWKTLERNRFGDRRGRDEAEWARYNIFRLGRQVLPLIFEDITKDYDSDKSFESARLFSALAAEEDLSLVLGLLSNDMVLGNPDGSAVSVLQNTLTDLVKDMRMRDPRDPRLDDVVETMVGGFEKLGNQYRKYGVAQVLAATGTNRARVFMESKGMFVRDTVLAWMNFEHIPSMWMDRVVMNEPGLVNRYPLVSDILRTDLRSQFGYYRDPILHEDQDVDSDNEDYFEVDSRIELVEEMVSDLGDLLPTVKGAVLLFTFNFLKQHTELNDHSREEWKKKISLMIKEEEKYADKDVPLPTIGDELEMPPIKARSIHRHVFEAFDIPHDDEQEDLLEVQSSFSYSPYIQSRMLEELAKMGAIELTSSGDGGLVIAEDNMLSLHLNFGIPNEVHAFLGENDYEDLDILMDALVYAYVSTNRLVQRKTSGYSYVIKADDVQRNEKTGSKRLEIKITEFLNFPTFRMNKEIQEMVGALFAFVKKTFAGMDVSEKEALMANEWGKFANEVRRIREEYGFEARLYDHNVNDAVELSNKIELRREMRSLLQSYSRKIRNIVFGE